MGHLQPLTGAYVLQGLRDFFAGCVGHKSGNEARHIQADTDSHGFVVSTTGEVRMLSNKFRTERLYQAPDDLGHFERVLLRRHWADGRGCSCLGLTSEPWGVHQSPSSACTMKPLRAISC